MYPAPRILFHLHPDPRFQVRARESPFPLFLPFSLQGQTKRDTVNRARNRRAYLKNEQPKAKLIKMNPLVAAAALTGAAATYLDAKYALRKDLKELRIGRNAIALWGEAGSYLSFIVNILITIPNIFQHILTPNTQPQTPAHLLCLTFHYSTVKTNRQSLYYLFERTALRRGNAECLWSRTGIYTWTETYDQVHRYANWFLKMGVKPGDYVAFYLGNSPEFVFAWLGLWAVGGAPSSKFLSLSFFIFYLGVWGLN